MSPPSGAHVALLALLAAFLGRARALGDEPEPPPTPPRAPFEVVARTSVRLGEVREEWGFPGASVGIVMPDGSLAQVVAGFADDERSRAVQPADRMLAGSVGKLLFATLALDLAAEGELELDAPLSRWVAGEPWLDDLPSGGGVTLRQLLRHESGLPDHVLLPELAEAVLAEPDRRWEPTELVELVLGRDPLFAPGEGFAYADTNYVLAGMAIERATGEDVYDLVRGRVLAPLGLRDVVPAVGRRIDGLVPGHPAPDDPFGWPSPNLRGGQLAADPAFEWTGGGFATTPSDLARFAHALFGGRCLPPERLAEMTDAAPTGSERSPGRYGIGVQAWESELGEVLGHEGRFPGYRSIVAHFADPGVTVAVQVNTDDPDRLGSLRELAADLARTALP